MTRSIAMTCGAVCAFAHLAGCDASDDPLITRAAAPEESARSDTTCGGSGNIRYVCGPVNAEDLIQLGNSDWLVASGMSGFQGPPDAGSLYLVNHVSKTYETWFPTANAVLQQDTATFGACPGPVDLPSFVAHGLGLQRQEQNHYRLFVTSHGAREAIEVFDINAEQSPPSIAWIGCVVLPPRVFANSVAALPDGGFVTTNTMDPTVPNGFAEMLTGKVTGSVYEWHPGGTVVSLGGTELSGPNGIAVSEDGRWMYVAASGSREIVRYDRTESPLRKTSVTLSILPDNLRWTDEGALYTAGTNDLPPSQCADPPCNAGWSVFEINADTLQAQRIASVDASATLQGASAAIAVANELWVGSHSSDRIAYLSRPSGQRE